VVFARLRAACTGVLVNVASRTTHNPTPGTVVPVQSVTGFADAPAMAAT